MLEVSTIGFVSKDGMTSDEITESFVQQKPSIQELVSRYLEAPDTPVEWNGFQIEFTLATVEEWFIKELFRRGMCTGMVYCGTVLVNTTTVADIEQLYLNYPRIYKCGPDELNNDDIEEYSDKVVYGIFFDKEINTFIIHVAADDSDMPDSGCFNEVSSVVS